MAISSPKMTNFPILKSIYFTIPHVDSWNKCTNRVDSSGVYLQEWYEIKKECIHIISIEAKRIFSVNFKCFCRDITSKIELRYNTKYDFGDPICENKYLIRWIKKTDKGISYLFTLIMSLPPDFFILEYETTNINEYNSDSSIYIKMLKEAIIIDYDPFQF